MQVFSVSLTVGQLMTFWKTCRWLNRQRYLSHCTVNEQLCSMLRYHTSASDPEMRKIPPRGNYAVLSQDDISFFKALLGYHRVITEPSEVEGYNVDWMKSYRGNSQLVLRPHTVDEVSKIMEYCNNRWLAVCPQGGNTGLVGGSVPVYDEVILSMSLMNKIEMIDSMSGIVVCQAGCVLEQIDNKLENHKLMVPLDLGARGTCQIGGNVSTNAGGLRLMRYGSLHGNVLGLEVVLANGMVIDCLSSLRKDNTGYDLKQLFIGSEGTLGVITKVGILCVPKPASVNIAFLACKSFENILQTFADAKKKLGEILTAFELIDQESMKVTQLHFHVKSPIEPITKYPFYALLETAGTNAKHDEEKLEAFVENALQNGFIEDGGLYTQPGQIREVWSIRERITAATLMDGYVFKYDISLPASCLYDLVPHLRQRLGKNVTRVNGFGHIGDGNIHVNITAPSYSQELHAMLEPCIFQWVHDHSGSISAEHGLGVQKRDYIHFSKTAEAVKIMKLLKLQFDPHLILNPYKVLPNVN